MFLKCFFFSFTDCYSVFLSTPLGIFQDRLLRGVIIVEPPGHAH